MSVIGRSKLSAHKETPSLVRNRLTLTRRRSPGRCTLPSRTTSAFNCRAAVRASVSSFKYRRYLNEETDALTAARQLNADVVLEGSVQRPGDRLRVSVNLLRTSDGVSLWADNFDLPMTDIFTIQDKVSEQ